LNFLFLNPLCLQLENGIKGDRVFFEQFVPIVGADQHFEVRSDEGGRVPQQDRGRDPVSNGQVRDGVGCTCFE
jgi:hypothetical protein